MLQIFKDSYQLMIRNLSLLYPVLFLSLVLSLIQPHGLPTLELRWFILGGLVFLLYSAFMAGWFSVLTQAVWLYKQPPVPGKMGLWGEPFGGLKTFFTGVGRFFLPFTLGWVFQLAAVLILIYTGWTLANQLVGLPPSLHKLLNVNSDAEVRIWITSLSTRQIAQLAGFAAWLLGSVMLYGLFYLATIFWMPGITLRQEKPWIAYGSSLKQFIRDPFRLLGLGLLYGLINYLLNIAWTGDDSLFSVVWQFLEMVNHLYFTLVMLFYFYSKHPDCQGVSLDTPKVIAQG